MECCTYLLNLLTTSFEASASPLPSPCLIGSCHIIPEVWTIGRTERRREKLPKEARYYKKRAPVKGDKQTTKPPFPAEKKSGKIISAPKKKGTVLGG
jgi:hypothetical protein